MSTITPKKYEFVWKPANGLKYIRENIYQLALKMVNSNIISVGTTLNVSNNISIFSGTRIFKTGENHEVEVTLYPTLYSNIETATAGNNVMCYTNTTAKLTSFSNKLEKFNLYCIAGYIQYMKDTDNFDGVLEDRKWYHNNLEEAELMQTFDIEFKLPTDLFYDVSDNLVEVAELLQERNLVSITHYITSHKEKSKYHIRTFSSLINSNINLDTLKESILSNTVDSSKDQNIYLHLNDYSFFDSVHNVIVLSGYIDYLRRTGEYESYKKRKASIRSTTSDFFDSHIKELPKLTEVLAIAENEKESSLWCAIQGERGVGKQKIVEQIALLLAQKGKIDSSDYICTTFDDLAVTLANKKRDDDYDNIYDNFYMNYTNFEKRKLYVLTNLKEFLYASKNSTEGDNKCISHLIKLLGRYQPQTYIIIVSEEKYIEQFLELTPQIKFLFANHIIHIENLSYDELFTIYRDALAENLKTQLDAHETFKGAFLDFIALNRRIIPLENTDLANFLADYANNQKELCLPPDIYRKKSAKAMLENVVGLENVKKVAYEFEKYAMFLRRAEVEGMEIPNNNMHMFFTGNPGTGKTMVARIIGQMLFDLGIVKANKVIEVEAKDLKAQYIGQSFAKTSKVIDNAMGGVLFIDEAYSIGSDSFGKEVIATLIKAMEDHKGNFIVIFAGYEKEMQEFLNINSGIASRIGYTFRFDDYSVEELFFMINLKLKNSGFTYDTKTIAPTKELCEYFLNKKNFGNGRFVDKVIQRIIIKHSLRDTVTTENINLLTPEDIPSISELLTTNIIESKDYETQLEEFIGMETVKEKVRTFAKFVEFKKLAKDAGASIPAGNMHMIFTGNPGTGKTTIARIMADMLYTVGVIKENKLVEVERKDLVAEHIGQTAIKTGEIIEKALDGVLFIDEAYSLSPKGSSNDFGLEAIATLIKAMEDHKDNLIVIFAGYRDQMHDFQNSNPGISSRIGHIFHFDNYTIPELLEMYKKLIAKSGFALQDDALSKVTILLEYFSNKKNFGNGRFVGKLQNETLMKHSKLITPDKSNLLIISQNDIPEISDLNNSEKKAKLSNELDSIIGMDSVKTKIKEFESLVNFKLIAREKGLVIPNFNMHMIFEGNPGTGKTTVARIIAQKLYDIGVIMENKVIEVERKDLIAGYIGQTAIKTSEIIEKAIGGILFIDEAYSLTPKSPSDFGAEAISTLIKAMEDHKDDLIVLFAGYESEMADFIDANPGISSRIGFNFKFEDYTANELYQIFSNKIKSNGFNLSESAKDKTVALMQYFCNVKNFGNGRFVDSVIQNTLTNHAMNFTLEDIDIIDEWDIPKITDMSKTMHNSKNMIAPDKVTIEESKRIAIHEIGHAFMQMTLFENSNIEKITIVAEGTGALGYVKFDKTFALQNTQKVYQNYITVLMAGLASEKVFLGDYADGGSSDINQATKNAKHMIKSLGMSKHGFAGTSSEKEITYEINEILDKAFKDATKIIELNRLNFEKASASLLENKEITQEELKEFFAI